MTAAMAIAHSGRLAFVVYGNPAPKGSKRGFVNKHTGRVALVESSTREKPWRQDVIAAAVSARNGAAPLDGPLVLRLVFTMPKPKSAPKSRRTYPDRKPDIDKLQRSVLDALVSAGVIADDARIVEVTRLAKVFPGEDREALEAPGARIEISGLDALESKRPSGSAGLFNVGAQPDEYAAALIDQRGEPNYP